MVTGKVVRLNEIRGYRFVATDSGGEDVFPHVNDLVLGKHLMTPGRPVEFVIEDGGRGLKAAGARLAARAPAEPAPAPAEDEDGLCDVLSERELLAEVTEAVLAVAPTMTGAQITSVRARMVELAHAHGWVES